ncbi:hypothetical protein [Gordonia soli]|uniref:Uncharacterized protein n=1 Tax=Gordonia soli NBRC 108243 TaxID=1223545 RepID=M0QIQ7_9ACTN|nr:hypothetical protein [Gordonia soli]GAC68423.1 hypothetical protein GS4_15_00730 [Gordonia soli NBRC 108243]
MNQPHPDPQGPHDGYGSPSGGAPSPSAEPTVWAQPAPGAPGPTYGSSPFGADPQGANQYGPGLSAPNRQSAAQSYAPNPYGGSPYESPAYGTPAYGAPVYGTPANVGAPYGPTSYPQNGQVPFGTPQFAGQYAPARASGATAIAASVLSFLGALASAIGVISLLFVILVALGIDGADQYFPGWFVALLAVVAVINIVVAGLLVGGGVAVLRRSMVGRTLIASGCAIYLVSGLALTISQYAFLSQLDTTGADVGVGGILGQVAGVVFPLITLVLVLVPSTTAWINDRPADTAPAY